MSKPVTPEELVISVCKMLDEQAWQEAHDKLAECLKLDPDFCPALLIARSLRTVRPFVFLDTEPGTEQYVDLAMAVSGEKRRRGKIFCDKICSGFGPVATYLSGLWYYFMEENHGHFADAARLIQLAMDLGDLVFSPNTLGFLNQLGRGVPHNDAECVRLYRIASDHGNATAIDNLGVLYESGEILPLNLREAFRLYCIGANNGCAYSQVNLGRMYDHGIHVRRNLALAKHFYHLAAKQGSEPARSALNTLR